jgi:hypothetical protein
MLSDDVHTDSIIRPMHALNEACASATAAEQLKKL